MAILDLKSNLSQWRKPTTVEAGEKKKLSESPVKAVYSTSTDLTTQSDIKINKIDNSTSIQVPGAKKVDYKLFSINSKRNRGIPAISTLFGDTILPKISQYKEQRPEEIVKTSEFVKITPRGIQHISTIEILKTILKDKTSLYKEQLPIDILKRSLYKDQLPPIIDKISLYKDQLPPIIDKLSLYKDQIPALLDKLSLYKDQLPPILSKLSLYKQFFVDNKNSIYDTRTEIIRLLRFPYTIEIYANKRMPATNAFDDLKSGARGFTLNQKEGDPSNFLGINGDTYTYPITVREGRLSDSTKIKGAQQWPLRVTFSNRLGNTTYNRTVYKSDKPYTSDTGITGDTLEKYFYRTNSLSARDIEYSAFNLRNNSFNTGLVLYNQPLILSGIQREDFVRTGFRFWETWKFDDGFIRGGVVTSTQRAIVDVLRIGKWYASVKGLLFTARQGLLQGAAPNTEADPLVGKRIGNGALTLASSLVNTATQHLGLRFRKDGLPIAPRSTYSSVLASSSYKNRLEKIYNDVFSSNLDIGLPIKTISGLGGPQSVYGVGSTNISRTVNSYKQFIYFTNTGVKQETKLPLYNNLGTNDKPNYIARNSYPLIDEDTVPTYNDELYLKLSNSTFAGTSAFSKLIPNGIFNFNSIGAAKLPFYEKASNKSLAGGALQQYYTLGYDDIRILAKASRLNNNIISNFLLNGSSDVEDAKWIPTKGDYQGTVIQNYIETSQHKRRKLRVPDYGRRGKDLRNPQPTMPDSDNFQYTYQGPGSVGMTDPIWQVNQSDAEAVDDFIKFMFHDLNTNERFRFRAYIENVSEDFSPSWQEVKILGRADSAYIYQGFERSLSVSFKVAALSRGDLMLMWDQLERLAKTTVPKYRSTTKMKGPLIKFTLGNWFINTPAFIRSLSYTVDNETPWEINLSNSGVYGGAGEMLNSNSVGELPMIVSVQVSMQIFGEVRPESTTANEDKILGKPGITDSTHYNQGNLYPLGNQGLRARRQLANYDVRTTG